MLNATAQPEARPRAGRGHSPVSDLPPLPGEDDLAGDDEDWNDPPYSSMLSGGRPAEGARIHALISATEPPRLAALAAIEMPDVPEPEQWGLANLIAEGLRDPGPWPLPEDRGAAMLSDLGSVEYVEDLIRPGRIVVVAAEEGSGKSYAISGELAIRVAAAGGSFAGTWPVLVQGPVLVLSEMHPDDDFQREETILASLGVGRAALSGCYYRLGLMTAAGGQPALTVPEWRGWITGWLARRGVRLLVIDTATAATQIDPWGAAIQGVYRDLRLMLEALPELSVALVLHMKKPQGRGDRRLSDVLGEWGRWCDVVVLMENEGANLDRVKITVRKRVRRERRIVASKAGGLLIDPKDIAIAGPRVPSGKVLAAVGAQPGITMTELAAAIEVSKATADRYVKALPAELHTVRGSARSGPGAAVRVYLIASSPQIASQEGEAMGEAITEVSSPHRLTPPIRGVAWGDAMTDALHLDDDLAERATDDDAEAAAIPEPEAAHRSTATTLGLEPIGARS